MLTSLGWWLDREHQAGRFQRVDELFLDFLVANARDRFEEAAIPSADKPVVLVKMRVRGQSGVRRLAATSARLADGAQRLCSPSILRCS
jgi:hypothetical protein